MEGTMMQGLSIFNKGRGAPAVRLGMEIERVRFDLYCAAVVLRAFFVKVQAFRFSPAVCGKGTHPGSD